MSARNGLMIALIPLLLASQGCTLQGLPYPTATPDQNTMATSAAATQQVLEAGMFPGSTPAPDTSTDPTPEIQQPGTTPTGSSFLIPSQTLKLVYIEEGNLWYWEEGQSPRQLTQFGDASLAALSQDASRAAFDRQLDPTSHELWVVNTDGSGARVLVDRAAFQGMTTQEEDLTAAPLQLDWLPGTELVVFSTRIISAGPGMQPRHELRSVNPSSRTMTVLADEGSGGEFSISPDGSRIALSLPDRISLVKPDGSGLRALHRFPHLNTGSEWWYYPPLYWNLDSTALRVALPPEDPRNDSQGLTQILHLPTDGSPVRTLGQVQTIPVFSSEAILSPDTLQLAYVGPSPEGEIQSGILYTAAADGSGALPKAEGQIMLYTWSPDSRHFLYNIAETNYIGDSAGTALVLDTPGYLMKIRFFDPARFLYLSHSTGNQQLWLGHLDGSADLIAESSTAIDYDFSE